MAIVVHASEAVLERSPLAKMAAKKMLADICKQYWPSVPLSQLLAAVRRYAAPVDDDGMAWQGILAGREGRTSIELEGVREHLNIQWYRLESGKYEITAYIL